MVSPGEVFVVQLARASRRANHFLRGLSRADRDDVLAAALLWCWENRESYSLTTTLETWFVNAVRDARKQWVSGNQRNRGVSLDALVNAAPTGDTTLSGAQAAEAAEKLIRALPAEYKHVANLQLHGYSRAEMMAAGASKQVIDGARSRIKQLRRLLPDEQSYRRTLRTVTLSSDDATDKRSKIDRELEQLEFAPPSGKDCPPCWKCKYFEGYLPGAHRPTRMALQEPEVRVAVQETEARKIEIAKRVRNGNV
jgi:DNA-directed RNA polymerase specialized sigma24 family protein